MDLTSCGKNLPERRSLSFGFSTSGSKRTCRDKIQANETSGTVFKSFLKKFRINFQDNFKTLNYIPELFRMLKKTSNVKILPKSSVKYNRSQQQKPKIELPEP